MNKHILIIILTFALWSKAYSQQCWDVIQTVTTDWRNYPPNGNGLSPNSWNWTADYPNFGNAYLVSNKNPITQQIVPVPLSSPFYNPYSSTFNNDNLLFLQQKVVAAKDFWPEDGWELLIKNFGECPNPPACYEATAVDHPFFALYNRLTGKVRAFVMVTSPSSTMEKTGAVVCMNYSNYSNIRRSIFAHAEPVAHPIESFNNDLAQSVPNKYNNESNYWLVADFQMSYDPCTCNNPSEISMIYFQYKLLINTKITLKGDVNIERTIINNTAGGVSPSSSGNLALFGTHYDLATLVKTGINSYKTYEGYRKDVKKFIDGQSSSTKAKLEKEFFSSLDGDLWINGHKVTKIDSLMQLDEGMKKLLGADNTFDAINADKFDASLLKGIASTLPYIGTAYGIVDFFISGGKKKAETKPTAEPMAFAGTMVFDGDLDTESSIATRHFFLPGSQNPSYNGAGLPLYNNTLGVVNLLNTPKLEYVHYEPTGFSACGSNITGATISSHARLRQYRLKEPLKYVINPASNLEVMAIDAAYVFEFDNRWAWDFEQMRGVTSYKNQMFPEFGDYANYDTLTYQERMERIGMDIDYQSEAYPLAGLLRVRTKYVPICNFKDQNFFLTYRNFSNDVFPNAKPKIFIKLIITLKRKDVTGADYVTVVQSYAIDDPINTATTTVPNQQYQTGAYIVGACGGYRMFIYSLIGAPYYYNEYYTSDLSFQNTTITTNQSASGNIYIGSNVIINNGVTISAGKNIIISSENNYGPEVIFQIQNNRNNTPCTLANSKATGSEISGICSSASYWGRATGVSKIAYTKDDLDRVLTGNPNATASNDFNVMPIPTSGAATLHYTLKESSDVSIYIMDLLGRKVLNVSDKRYFQNGNYELPIDLSGLDSGLYKCVIVTDNDLVTKNIVLTK